MKALDFQKALESIDKLFFSTSDIEKITGLSRDSLKVSLSRLVKKDLIVRLSRGIFILPKSIDKIPEIANQLYSPSYLSFESALSRYGIISQVPYTITFATLNRSKRMILGGIEVEYRQVKKDLFTGFSKENNFFVASPEKALLDEVYLVSRGLASIAFDELDLGRIDKKLLCELSKNYPNSTQILLKKVIGS